MTWNQARFNKRRLAVRILAHPLVDSTLRQPGFVHTRGGYGWLLIGPVFHDSDLYRRRDATRGTVYGSVSAMLETGMPEVELLTQGDLIRAALAAATFLRVERQSDLAHFDVAMLHPWMTRALPRSCGLHLDDGGGIAALNPELPAHYNQPPVRYRVVQMLTDGRLAARLSEFQA